MVESFNGLDRGLYKLDSSFKDIKGAISFDICSGAVIECHSGIL
jgi:hypothetical protein